MTRKNLVRSSSEAVCQLFIPTLLVRPPRNGPASAFGCGTSLCLGGCGRKRETGEGKFSKTPSLLSERGFRKKMVCESGRGRRFIALREVSALGNRFVIGVFVFVSTAVPNRAYSVAQTTGDGASVVRHLPDDLIFIRNLPFISNSLAGIGMDAQLALGDDMNPCADPKEMKCTSSPSANNPENGEPDSDAPPSDVCEMILTALSRVDGIPFEENGNCSEETQEKWGK